MKLPEACDELCLARVSVLEWQREYDLPLMFNALRWRAETGTPWQLMSHEFVPLAVAHQQTQHWQPAGCFEAIANDLRSVFAFRPENAGFTQCGHPRRRPLQSTRESGPGADYDCYKRQKGEQIYMSWTRPVTC